MLGDRTSKIAERKEEKHMEKQIIKGSELADKELEVQEDGSLRIVEKGRFIPINREVFWYVSVIGSVCSGLYVKEHPGYQWLIKHNLVFRTREECDEYKRYLELLDEYTFEPDWNDKNMCKWYIRYNFNGAVIYYDYFVRMQFHRVYFASKERAKEFVKKAGESNVKKFMFDIWE